MFEFPLLEVIQAIEELRESRGTTNQQICDFVRQQGRNPNDPMKILKTIRTLNKLVEEGVLVKKGKRYVFPTKPPEFKEDEEEERQDDDGEEEQEPEPDSCDEENDEDDDDEEGKTEEDEGGKDEEQMEDEDEDDDDDDDDDEEDDDDDDDDDDDNDDDEQCNDKDAPLDPKVEPCTEGGATKGLGQQKSALNSGEPKATDNVGDNQERTDKIASNPSDNTATKKNCGRKNVKGQNSYEKKNSNKGKNKGGEAIAFCARDFIDSLCSQNSTPAKPVAQHEKPQDDLIEIENFDSDPVGRVFGMRKRESKSKKSRAENDCRSRSPIRGYVKNGYFIDLKLNHSEELRKNMISSQIFQEVTDTPMDVDNDNEVIDLDYDILRQRSPIGPQSAIAPGVHLQRTESCCSQPINKSPEITKAEADFDCKSQYFLKKKAEFKRSKHSMARAIDMQNKRLAAKEAADKDKEKHKRERSLDEGDGIKTEKGASLCSVCEKKKRNS